MCAVARRGLSALRLPMAASWAGPGALGPLRRLLISCRPTGGLALRLARQPHAGSRRAAVGTASCECFQGCSPRSVPGELMSWAGVGSHRAGVGTRMGLRKGVGSSFSLASGRLRLSAEEGVLGPPRGGSSAVCVTRTPV